LRTRSDDHHVEGLPPVILLGGEANALSVARDLGRAGVTVYALGEPDAPVMYSRYCRWLPVAIDENGGEGAWTRYLLGSESAHLRGAVVLSCSDAGLAVLIRHRDALLERYRLDASNPAAQLAMLDKLTTYQCGREAGVPTPGFWRADSREHILALRDELVFPLLVKPRLSHLFEERFGRKHMIVSSFDELLAVFAQTDDARTDVLLMEHIPGPDDRLCSYYTYLDEAGAPLFHFTKRIIRRYPAGMGTACYHVTDRIPELHDLANRLFARAGLRGVANVEFKWDTRDGRYKLIECNARFTASNCLVSASGINLARFVYNRIVGRPLPPMHDYRTGLRLWDPLRDACAFLELRKEGRLGLFHWLGSVAHRQSFAYFAWTDPMPAIARALRPVRKILRRAFTRLTFKRPGAGAQPA
jgi:predicted ATP-grasp superfamily ATP-dependent carboligase